MVKSNSSSNNTTAVATVSNKRNALANVIVKSLPALSGSDLTYNAEKNLYLTTGYTSAAGNTYFKAIRFSENLAVYLSIGVGYCHTFLNGITLFAWDGTKPRMISQKSFNCHFFNEHDAEEHCVLMLRDFLEGQAKLMGAYVTEKQLLSHSRQMISETYQRRLA